MNTNNKIPAKRIPLTKDIEFKKSYARQNSKGILKNISLTGAFIEENNKILKKNENLVIIFKVNDNNRSIKAHVIWTNEYGAGIQFKYTNQRDHNIVADLIEFVTTKKDKGKITLEDIFKKVA